MNIKDAIFQLVANTNDILIITEIKELDYPKGPNIVYVNKAFTSLTEYRVEEILGRTPRVLQGKDTDKKVLEKIKNTIKERKSGKFELINYTKSGRKYWLEINLLPIKDQSGEVVYYGSIQRDITNLKVTNEKLKKQNYTDKLTKVYNRAYLEETYFNDFDLTNSTNHTIGLLVIDVDNFKQLNDAKGHLFGDKILQEIAELLLQNCRKNQDDVIRYSGDEFIIVYKDANPDIIKLKANNIVKSAEILSNHDITLSLGGCFYKKGDKKFKSLINRADEGLYQAKALRNNSFVFQD